MKSRMPARLTVLIALGFSAGVLILVRGLQAEGGQRLPTVLFGAMALFGVAIMVGGWLHAKRKE